MAFVFIPVALVLDYLHTSAPLIFFSAALSNDGTTGRLYRGCHRWAPQCHAVISLMVPSAFHRFLGAGLPNPCENALNIALSITLLVAYGLYLIFMLKTHPDFFRSKGKNGKKVHQERWSMKRALTALVIASLFAAFMSEILVGAVEETGKALGMSSVFIGRSNWYKGVQLIIMYLIIAMMLFFMPAVA